MNDVLMLAALALEALVITFVLRILGMRGRHQMTRATRRRVDLIGARR